MKTILAIGISAAALFAVSSVANAQSDCLNGWHMIKDNIPVRCDVVPSAFSGPGTIEEEATLVSAEAAPVEEPVPVEEPLYTGSIDTGAPVEEPIVTGSIDTGTPVPGSSEAEQPPRPGGPYEFAASREECQPGQFWMMELNSGNRPVACE